MRIADEHADLFDSGAGGPSFHGLPVIHRNVDIAGKRYRVAGVVDAADLLDLPRFEERFLKQDMAPYGLELWPASIMLAECIARGEPGGGRSALELGCGLGLGSVVAARCGWRVTATDNDGDALRFARYTASINDAAVEKYALLDWNRPPAGARFSRLLAADVLYQLVDHVPLLNCIDALLADEGAALIADPNRGVADRFPALAGQSGFYVDIEYTDVTLADGSRLDGRIFRLTQ